MPAGSSRTPAWLQALFACIDRRDADGFGGYVTEDAQFRFANAPVVSGRREIVAAVGQFFDAIGGLSHDIGLTLCTPSHTVCQGEVTYTRLDGSEITLPFVNVFEMADILVCDYRIYADLTPLWDPTTA